MDVLDELLDELELEELELDELELEELVRPDELLELLLVPPAVRTTKADNFPSSVVPLNESVKALSATAIFLNSILPAVVAPKRCTKSRPVMRFLPSAVTLKTRWPAWVKEFSLKYRVTS